METDHVVPSNHAWIKMAKRIVQRAHFDFNLQKAAVGHGVARVQADVHPDTLASKNGKVFPPAWEAVNEIAHGFKPLHKHSDRVSGTRKGQSFHTENQNPDADVLLDDCCRSEWRMRRFLPAE
jgi:hypothetical protein